MTEKWCPVKGYEGRYEVSNKGRVRSLGRTYISAIKRVMPEKLMTLCDHHHGYKIIWLRNGITHKKFFVHRLVAIAFLKNPDNKDVVNHIDENKSNNNVSNLEWMTLSENTQYYYANRKRLETVSKPSDMDEVNQITASVMANWTR